MTDDKLTAAEAVKEANEMVVEGATRSEGERIVDEANALAVCLLSLSKIGKAERKRVVGYLNERFNRVDLMELVGLVIAEDRDRRQEIEREKTGLEIEIQRLTKALAKCEAVADVEEADD